MIRHRATGRGTLRTCNPTPARLVWQVAELKAALDPLDDEQRARFIDKFRTEVLGQHQAVSSPVALASGAAPSTAAVASAKPAPRPGELPAPSVQASAPGAALAPGIPGLGASPLPRSFQPVAGARPIGAGPINPSQGPVLNGAPPKAMGGTVAGAYRVAPGLASDSSLSTAEQPPYHPPAATGVRTSSPATPSPPPLPPSLSPLITEFEAMLMQAPIEVLHQHGDRLDKMRAALAEIDPQRGAVLVRSVRDLLLGPLLPGGAHGVTASPNSQPAPLSKASTQPAAQNRMARDAALQRSAISVPGATFAARPSLGGSPAQPTTAGGRAGTAQPAAVPMRRQSVTAQTATGAPAAAPGAAPLGRMSRAAGAGQPAPPWASLVSREVAAAAAAPASSGAAQRMQTLAATAQCPSQAAPLPASRAGVPVARPPAGLPAGLPMVRAGPLPASLSNGSGPAAAMAPENGADASYVSTPDLLRRLTELSQQEAAKLVIKVAAFEHPAFRNFLPYTWAMAG